MKTLFLLLFSLYLFSACQSTKENSNVSTTPKSYDFFHIQVEQNGRIVPVKNNIIRLQKSPFQFKIRFKEGHDVFWSASWGTYYYDYPADKNIFECQDKSFFKGCRFVSIKTGNEDKFNEDKDIYVGDGSYQFVWFYMANKDWHRMDKGVELHNGWVNASVTVENIYDLDKRDAGTYKQSAYQYPVDQLSQDIHMTFATSHYESGMEHPEELQRQKFILRFY